MTERDVIVALLEWPLHVPVEQISEAVDMVFHHFVNTLDWFYQCWNKTGCGYRLIEADNKHLCLLRYENFRLCNSDDCVNEMVENIEQLVPETTVAFAYMCNTNSNGWVDFYESTGVYSLAVDGALPLWHEQQLTYDQHIGEPVFEFSCESRVFYEGERFHVMKLDELIENKAPIPHYPLLPCPPFGDSVRDKHVIE